MTRVALPFVQLPVEAVEAGEWEYSMARGEELLPLADEVPHWDPFCELEFSRRISLDAREVRQFCRLGSRDSLILAVQLESNAGRRRCVARTELLTNSAQAVPVGFTVRGEELADEVRLCTELVLGAPGTAVDHFAAKLPGSRLWSDLFVTRIEGSRSQFPIEAVDFSEMPWIPAPASPWYLSIDSSDPSAPFLACVRLYINAGNDVMSRLKDEPQVRSFMQYDVARSLLSTVMPDPIFKDGAQHFEDSSLGAVVRVLAANLLPGYTPAEAARMIERRPADFESLVRGGIGLLHGGC